jgi:hypothetical protein
VLCALCSRQTAESLWRKRKPISIGQCQHVEAKTAKSQNHDLPITSKKLLFVSIANILKTVYGKNSKKVVAKILGSAD